MKRLIALGLDPERARANGRVVAECRGIAHERGLPTSYVRKLSLISSGGGKLATLLRRRAVFMNRRDTERYFRCWSGVVVGER
jgi:hypothetical protein